MTNAKKKWTVVTMNNETKTVTAERAEEDKNRNRVNFYNGDELVAGFIALSEFYPEQ